MSELISFANIFAVFAAVGTALLGVITYRRRKEIDLDYKQGEIKRQAVTEYLSSLDALINHAAYSDGQKGHDEAAKIISCKEHLNKIYIYAPARLTNAMDTLLTEAIALSSIISKIPNSQIFDEDQALLYENETMLTHEAYIRAVNIAREEVGLHSDPVSAVQLLLLGKNDPV